MVGALSAASGGASPAAVGAALDEAALLELVDEPDHPAGRRLDRLGDLLLRAPLCRVDQVEDAEQRRREVDLGQPRREAGGGVDSDL